MNNALMSDNQIKAAEAIMKIGEFSGSTTFSEVFGQNINEGWNIDDITSAAEYMETKGFINMITTKNGGYQYRLTPMGNKFREDGKSIADFIAGEKQKELKAVEKEERDEHYKTLQVRDLEEKLNIMNVEQRDFWNQQKQRNWQTTLISIISAVFSFVAMLKAFGYF